MRRPCSRTNHNWSCLVLTACSLALSVCRRHSCSRTSRDWSCLVWMACSLALSVCRRHPCSRTNHKWSCLVWMACSPALSVCRHLCSSQDWSCSVWTTCSLALSVCRHPGSRTSQSARTGHAQCGRPAVNSVQPAVGQHRCQNLLSHSGLQLRQSVWHHVPVHPGASHRVQRLLQWK